MDRAGLLLAAFVLSGGPVAASSPPGPGPPAAGVPPERTAPPERAAQPATSSSDIVLLTVGPDPTRLFRAYGHASLCVGERCFNYGTTDFSRPAGLLFDVLAGSATFWLSTGSYHDVLRSYSLHGRSIFRQELDLAPAERDVLLELLVADLVPGAGEYIYGHFTENCSTRPRDYLDAATDGRLRRTVSLGEGTPADRFRDRSGGYSFRPLMRRGLVGRPFLIWVSDAFVGSASDAPVAAFDAMFLPEGLRLGVERELGVPAERIHSGTFDDNLPPDPGSAPYLPWLFGGSLALSGFVLLPRSDRASGAARTAAASLLAVTGALGLFLVLLSPLPEFRSGLLFAAVPVADVLLGTRHARWYAPARLAYGAAFLVALGFGVTAQPLEWTVLAAMLPVAAIIARDARARRRRSDA